jgi:trk system potassium uptake protein TrkA
MSQSLYVVIVGCGRLGSALAGRLSAEGHGVVAIDRDEHAFAGLPPEYSGFRLEGDATEISVLREAKMQKADVVVAATREDNINLMVSQIARRVFEVPRVLARVFDPRREALYRRWEVETICPTGIAAALLLERIHGEGEPK